MIKEMTRNELKEDIVKFLADRQLSIKYIADHYNNGSMYISKLETKRAIKELISEGILVKVEDADCFGEALDDVVLNEDE